MTKKLVTLFILLIVFAPVVFSQISGPSLQTSFQNFVNAESGRVYTGSGIPVFLIKENTKGSRYLFDKWVKGTVTNVQGEVYKGSNVVFNYDKLGQKLLVFLDSTTTIELNSGDIGSFTIGDGQKEYHFERVKNSTNLNFYQAVYKNEKGYSLYKLLTTKFKKADFQTNGLFESGNKYDEYTDQEEYFIVTNKQELSKIIFKKKAIEKALEKESSKVDEFFSKHKADSVDETFIINLLAFLNIQ